MMDLEGNSAMALGESVRVFRGLEFYISGRLVTNLQIILTVQYRLN
jgi:hypothetical protein